MTNAFDPFLLFAEDKGIYLTERQLLFCRTVVSKNDSLSAYILAGFVGGIIEADQMYDMFKALIEAWRKQQKLDYDLVLNVHRRAATATIEFKSKEDETKTITLHDYKTQNMGAKGLRDVLGFDAAKQVENTITDKTQISQKLRDMLDGVYKQTASE